MIFHQEDKLVYPVGFVEALIQGDWKNMHGGGDI